jgi:succinate dehydrogenase hydrophobic anchor subunit
MADRAVGERAERSSWKRYREAQKASRVAEKPSWGWILQAVTGVFVLVLITVHMVANHFIVSRGLRDFHDVIAYLSNPFVIAWEVVFLVVVTWHGLLGLRAVLFDFGFGPRAQRRISLLLAAVGVVAVVYGMWLTAVIVSHG